MLAQIDSADNSLTRLLFESPGWAVCVLALMWAALRIGGRRTGNKKMMRISWAPLVLLAALLVVSSQVTTKREKLPKAMNQLMLAVEYKDIPRFRELVLPNAMTLLFVREMGRDEVEKMIDKATIDDLKVTSSSVVIEGDSAAMMVIIRADGEVAGAPGVQLSRWLFRWTYVDGQWRVQRMRCEAIGADAVFGDD